MTAIQTTPRIWPTSDHRWELPVRPTSNPDAAVYDALVGVLDDLAMIATGCPDGAAIGWLAMRTTVRDRIDAVTHSPVGRSMAPLLGRHSRVRRRDHFGGPGLVETITTAGGVEYAIVAWDGGGSAQLPIAVLESAGVDIETAYRLVDDGETVTVTAS